MPADRICGQQPDLLKAFACAAPFAMVISPYRQEVADVTPAVGESMYLSEIGHYR